MKLLSNTAPWIIAALAAMGLPALADEDGTASGFLESFQRQLVGSMKTRSLTDQAKAQHRGLVIAISEAASAPEVEEITFDAVPEKDQVNIRINFDLNSATLRAGELRKLGPLCAAMSSDELWTTTFRIIGHTDASGTEALNESLSVFRAKAVLDHMTGECEIARHRLQAVGVGERYLAQPDDPLADVNRRVEFQAIGELQG